MGSRSLFSTRTLVTLFASVLLVPASLAMGQNAADEKPMALDDGAADATVVESTETTEITEAEPFDLMTTKRLTGDWGGARTWMDDNGIDFSIVYTAVWQQNFRGGIETHNADDFSGDLRLNLYLDLDKMGLIKDAFFFARGKSSYNNSVQGNVGSLTSTAWVVANGDQEFYLDKWWYGQRFLDDKIEFRIGKLLTPIDLFDGNAYAQSPWDQFINAALCRNSTFPHRKAYGAYLNFKPWDNFYFRMAGIDADQRDANRCASFDTTFHEDARFIGMWEFGFTPKFASANGDLPGNYRFGWHYDPRPGQIFRDTHGGRVPANETRGDDIGFYLSFDQFLYKENDQPKDKQGLGAFLRYGYAHRDINAVSNFWSLGAQYQGLIPERDKDILAFGVAQSIMSDRLRDDLNNLADRETVYELYYKIQVTPWLALTPDVQIITHPGGNKTADNAIVGSIRAKITF